MKHRALRIAALLLLLTGCAGQSVADTTAPEASVPETTLSIQEEPTMPKEYRVTDRELTISHGDRTVYGKLYTPEGEGIFPAVIFSHGYNGSHRDFTRECRYFASKGFIAYALDFCGGSNGSKSSGSSTDMTIFTEKEDLLAVLDHIRALEQVDGENVFLMGGSQGGLVTGLAAAERKEQVKGLILYFPAFNIPDNWRSNYPTEESIPEVTDFWGLKLGKNFFMSMRDLDPYAIIGAFDKNVLILHGDQDAIVPLSSSRRAAEIYPHARLIVLQGEGHGFTPLGGNQAMKDALEFLLAQI